MADKSKETETIEKAKVNVQKPEFAKVSQSTKEVEIEILEDYKSLLKGQKHTVSKNTAEVLIVKKVAKLVK